MEMGLTYSLMLSLQEIALRRVAVILCNGPDILNLIGKFKEYLSQTIYNQREWLNIVECITAKMSKLELPKSLQEKMVPILKAVSSEIFKWKIFHTEYLSARDSIMDGFHVEYEVSVLKKLYWTTAGSIDCRKTAEELMLLDALDVSKRFELACIYCLEDSIRLLWNKLPEESKIIFFGGDPSEIKEPHLHLFLPYIVKKDCIDDLLPQSMNFRFYFEHFSFSGNKSLVEYCYRRLAPEEREESLDQVAGNIFYHVNTEFSELNKIAEQEKLSEIFYHLLSLVTPEEQIRIFKKHPFFVLACFLHWPRQDLFLDVADIMWTFLPETEYDGLLNYIHKKTYNRTNFYFKNLFHNFILRSPIDFAKHFLDEANEFLYTIASRGDTETIKTVFRSMEAAGRARVALSDHFLDLLYRLAHMEDYWHLVESCLREAALSLKDKRGLKEAFIEYLQRGGNIEQMVKFRQLFEFLDTTDEIAQTLT